MSSEHELGRPAGIPKHLNLAPQLRRLVETAWSGGEDTPYKELHLRAWAHTLGFRGHFATKSRRYSTTFGELRSVRQEWQVAKSTDDEQLVTGGGGSLDGEVFEVREWKVKGIGYASRGDARLAEGLARTARAARRATYEDRIFEPGKAD